MTDLTESIQNLYQGDISQGEAKIAKNNLVGFFQILSQIDKKQRQHKVNISKEFNKEVIESYENNRSTN